MKGNDAWLDTLKEKFAARLIDESDALLALASVQDREGLVDRAHKLAGIAGMLGAPAVGEAAQRLEEAVLSDCGYDADLRALLATIAEHLN